MSCSVRIVKKLYIPVVYEAMHISYSSDKCKLLMLAITYGFEMDRLPFETETVPFRKTKYDGIRRMVSLCYTVSI